MPIHTIFNCDQCGEQVSKMNHNGLHDFPFEIPEGWIVLLQAHGKSIQKFAFCSTICLESMLKDLIRGERV